MSNKKFLITGVRGQIGSKLLPNLIEKYGAQNVIATDVVENPDFGSKKLNEIVKYRKLDVTNKEAIEYIINDEKINYVLHLASILSALAEREPELGKKVNLDSVHFMFRLSIKFNLN